jgi:hypothetical protein
VLIALTVDRKLPNYSSQNSYLSELITYKSGEVYDTIATGNTSAYWDSGTLSFDSASNIVDVPVWNMNTVWCENLAGITGLQQTYMKITLNLVHINIWVINHHI